MKRFLTFLLIIPLCAFCKPDNPEQGNDKPDGPEAEIVISGAGEFSVGYEGGSVSLSFTSNREWTVTTGEDWLHINPASGQASETPVTVNVSCDPNETLSTRDAYLVITAGDLKKTARVYQSVDPYAGAETELVSGTSVLATNPNVEKFLNEVTYPDKDWSFTKVLDYYGGFNGKKYNANGQEDPAGEIFTWGRQPNSDKPMSYSIRWSADGLDPDSPILFVLEDKLGWKSETDVASGSLFVNITNLVPNDEYRYKATSTSDGKVLAEGSFSTTGSLHQVFFRSGCRNGRDLGGWKTLDGKTVKYRKLYRGGRMQSETVNKAGQKEILAEGIRAQLDLRNSDRISKSPVEGVDFLAPGIETGGTTMLKKDKDKTKQCFDFVLNSLRNSKPVYFHCSLGRDRTGTLDILLLGLLGVREGDISKAYEVTYFAPVGYSVSSSEKDSNPTPVFKNTRREWVYSDVAPYFWSLAGEGGTFADGVQNYLLSIGVTQEEIDEFRAIMLE